MWRTESPWKQGILALLLLLIGMLGTACADDTLHHATPTPTAPGGTTPAGHVSLTPTPPDASVAYVAGLTPEYMKPTTYFVAALNTADGSVRWRYTVANAISQIEAVGDIVLFEYSATQSANLEPVYLLAALNASDGSVRWTYSTAGLAQFVAQGSAVYLGISTRTPSTTGSTTSGVIMSLDIRSGAIRWRKTLTELVGQPTVADSLLYDYVYFAPTSTSGPTSEIIALDINTGKQQWLYTAGTLLETSEGETGPLVIGNTIYMRSVFNLKAGHPLDDLVALDAKSGSVRWHSIIGGQLIGLSTDGNAIYLSATLISPSGVLQSPGYEVEALRANDGQTLWNTPLTYVPSAPILGDNKVFITANGALTEQSPVDMALALSAADGRMLWSIPGTVAFLSGDNPATDGALVYVVTYRLSAQVSSATPFPANTEVSLIKAIRVADGQQAWETPLSVGIYPLSPDVTNGALFVTFSGYRPDLAVLDAATGSIRWRFGAPSSEITHLALPA